MKRFSGAFFTALVFSLVSFTSFAQEMSKICAVTPVELKSKYTTFFRDDGVQKLRAELSGKGFAEIKHPAASFGFTGQYVDSAKKSYSVEFYAFDYYNKSTNQTASIIWRNDGRSIYKAYLIFPAGEKNFEKALESSVEIYADKNNKLQKASSFGKMLGKVRT